MKSSTSSPGPGPRGLVRGGGALGSNTQNAVAAFRSAGGITADGAVGREHRAQATGQVSMFPGPSVGNVRPGTVKPPVGPWERTAAVEEAPLPAPVSGSPPPSRSNGHATPRGRIASRLRTQPLLLQGSQRACCPPGPPTIAIQARTSAGRRRQVLSRGRRPSRHATHRNEPDSPFPPQVRRGCEPAFRGYAESRPAKLLVSDGPQSRNGLPGVRRAVWLGFRQPVRAWTDGKRPVNS